ncbi:hypothetical protein KIW84_035486 [Lathyrus oleraceus]|uniref:C2H2-type domain-containing protein n=1 Tax=Pisum sativum TaxID=3888 RepID=A0A9D4Y2B8_PEA|nr:hypothetical protein KIW84_035486 [Pisum sativum]
MPEKSHKCSKRKNNINTIDNDHGHKKRLKLYGNMINEKIKEQAVTPSTGHVSDVDETVKIKVKDNYKGFSSNKALYGHMRIHKKDNKGIPPRPASSSQNIDLSKYLPPRSHKCCKRNYDINTIDDQQFSCDYSHGEGKRRKLQSNMVDERIREQAATPNICHLSDIDREDQSEGYIISSYYKNKLVLRFKILKRRLI